MSLRTVWNMVMLLAAMALVGLLVVALVLLRQGQMLWAPAAALAFTAAVTAGALVFVNHDD